MKIVSAYIYALNIPFVDSFSHNLYERHCSDSIVVKLTTECGISGFGEGVPRPYVTGETKEKSVEYIRRRLLPEIIGAELDGIDIHRALAHINGLLPGQDAKDRVVWNASRCAVELAVVDCLFRCKRTSVNMVLPAKSQEVTYSGVIATGSVAKVEKIARRWRDAGFEYIKMKVSQCEDTEQIAVVRNIMGPSASIRLDANGAFNPETAVRFLSSAAAYDIECIEQPIPRGDPAELAALRSTSPIPVMADESVVTILDAKDLIKESAVDYFNLRISKCGGLHNTLALAELARSAGIGIQLGCQVGETAILSSAGRHLAAHLEGLRFVEGSYGTLLLVEDISEEDTVFGPGGSAPILTGAGLGITVREELLNKYAQRAIPVR